MCVTVALNAKRTQRAPLLVPTSASPDPASAASIRSHVVKAAQSKLKLKKPTRFFVGGTGQELKTAQEWKDELNNDAVVLVSAGEDYVGVRKESGRHEEANSDCPVYVLAENAPVDGLSVTQLTTTAHTLPGIVLGVGQPDLHPGTKFPIGAVFVSQQWVHPPLIGSDIGCGMAWYKTKLTRNQVDGDKGKRVAEKLRGLEGAWRTQAARELWLQGHDGRDSSSCSAGPEWDVALGTIGAGNHFAEIQVVEKSENEDSSLHQDEVILLVHSGSRGYGGSILKKHTSDSHTTSFREGTKEMQDYMTDHDRACRWAKANRDLIAVRFLACLEPGEEAWELGRNGDSDPIVDLAAAISCAKARVRERRVVDIWHNHVERVKWPPGPPPSSPSTADQDVKEGCVSTSIDDIDDDDDDDGQANRYAYIHRKGAAPTHDPLSTTTTPHPLPLLPLPGSRGTPTLMLRPAFSAATGWGARNALSLAHGAGRAMSRARALASLGQKYKHREGQLLEPTATGGERRGTWVVCEERDLVFEEAPEAYKDVFAVGEDLAREGVAEVVGACAARVSYKVRKEAR
ncbi:hypothetical protein BS50DRAFT_483287 [Corynespora cassiicola Philippines]|uniref:3'-phosphate/5'-hydroxy nucleic acid ligase n=1 Tax=Corynespora cassiicola Philippines TaxID=1448308 RepID=A0A2T2P5P5_CORCC|nr:hypothetical protein BS50DRAFT_483287 [Corynespora cassiicola Philippines]